MPLVTFRSAILLALAALLAACAWDSDSRKSVAAPGEAVIVPLVSERPLIALALGGGGTRGFAHVGVIKALEEAGVVPDIITGSSSGAIIAALYASGRSGRELEAIALELTREDLVDVNLIGRGWVRGEALQAFVNRMVRDLPIERLARPFAVIATAAKDGRMAVFNRGNTGIAVRASASVPNLFVPPTINGEEYVDGGLSSPVPVRVARAMGADVVIAVDVSWFAAAGNRGSAGMEEYGRRGRYAILADELKLADVVVSPRTAPARMLDFEHKEANIAAGAQAARELMPRVEAAIARAAGKKTARGA